MKFPINKIVDFFVLDICSKPIFCSKVAQKGKICSRLLEPQKVVRKAYPLVRPSLSYNNLCLSNKHFITGA